MRTSTAILLLLATVLGTAGPVASQSLAAFTAENLRDACDNLVLAVRGISPISQEDPGAMLCLGYIAGWVQAMERVPDRAFCLPPPEQSLPGDLADLIVTYVDGHPERAPAPAHEVVEETFIDAFPCDSEATEPPEDEEP
jgi:hypothetical protein